MASKKYHKAEVKKQRIKYLGTQFTHNVYGKYTIIEYNSNNDIVVEFDNTGYVTKAGLQAAKRGGVKDLSAKSLYGIACYGVSVKDFDRGLEKKAYRSYVGLIERVYTRPTHSYSDCFVREDWLNFQRYKEFFCEDPYRQDDWQLDKDLLIFGNKEYSKDTCVFLPTEINNTIKQCPDPRKIEDQHLPFGVSTLEKDKTRYKIYTTAVYLGLSNKVKETFDCPIAAQKRLKEFKTYCWNYLADKWEGKIDQRAVHALRTMDFYERCNYT